MNKIILSHSGKQHSYHVAKALDELGMLEKFFTSSYVKQKFLQDYFLKNGNTYFTRRFIEGISGNLVDANWRFELKEITFRKLYGKTERTQNAVYERDVLFDKYVARKIRNKSNTFWGFQGSCYESLRAAQNTGNIAICELATAHAPYAKKILGEEQKLHPEWADSIDNLVFPVEYEQHLCEEPHRADKVISASSFTTESLLYDGISPDKILYLPLGFDASKIPFEKVYDPAFNSRPLKVLYAGTVTQRKGIKYALEAMLMLSSKDLEFYIIGGIQGSGDAFRKYKNYIYHEPVSQSELFKFYKDFDVFLLPSVFEGFGLVIVEAMAAGLPVITTAHTMGPEVIENDKNGYIVPVGDSNAIAGALTRLKNKSSDEFYHMQNKARNSAMRFTWNAYQARLLDLVKKINV